MATEREPEKIRIRVENEHSRSGQDRNRCRCGGEQAQGGQACLALTIEDGSLLHRLTNNRAKRLDGFIIRTSVPRTMDDARRPAQLQGVAQAQWLLLMKSSNCISA